MSLRRFVSLAVLVGPLLSCAVHGQFARAQANCPGTYVPPNGMITENFTYHRTFTDVVSTYGHVNIYNDGGKVTHTGGVVNINGDLKIHGRYNDWAISGGSLSVRGGILLGMGGGGELAGTPRFTQSGGVATVNSLRVGTNGNPGELLLSGGELTVGKIQPDLRGGWIHLNGGTLITSCFVPVTGGNAGAFAMYFNGATVRAADGIDHVKWFPSVNDSNSPLAYYVGDGGARFDTGAQTMVLPAELQHLPGASAIDGGLIKYGSGSLRLSGNSSYTGRTGIEAGTLIVSHSANLGAANNGFGLWGGTLRIEGTSLTSFASRVVDPIWFNGTIEIVDPNNTVTIPQSLGNGQNSSITKRGPGTLVFSGENSWTGGTNVYQGTLRLGGAPTAGTGVLRGHVTVSYAALELAAVDAMGHAAGRKIDSVYVDSGAIHNTAAGNNGWGVAYTLASAQMISNGGTTSTTAPSNFTFGSGSSVRVVAGVPSVIRGRVDLRNDAGANTDFIVDDAGNPLHVHAGISGPGQLTKRGPGILELLAENIHTGDSVVQQGELSVTHPLALQNSTAVINGGAIAFRSVATATFGGLAGTQPLALRTTGNASVALGVGNNNASTTYTGAMSGGGSLTKIGNGTLTLGGTSSYSGGTTVNAGTLALAGAAGNGIGSVRGALTINSGARVTTTVTDATGWADGMKLDTVTINGGTLDNTSAGSNGWGIAYALNGATLRSNGGTGSVTATSHFSFGGPANGNTSVAVAGATPSTIAGRIDLRSDGLNTATNFTVADGSRLNVPAGISSAGPDLGINKLGAGVMALEFANNTYAGSTQVNAGTLLVTGSTGTGAVGVASGATLAGSGQVRGATTVSGGGRLAPGNAIGTLTFANGLSLGNGAIAAFDLGSSSDRIRISGGTFTGSGTGGTSIALADSGGFAPGNYTLIDFSGAAASGVDAADFVLGNTIAGPYDYAITVNGAAVVLAVTLRDTTPPQITAVTVPPARTYRAGEALEFLISFSEATLVTGAPRLPLVLDSGLVHAGYVSGGGSTTLLFRHVIAAGSNDADGIALGAALEPNGGTLRDAAANNALLTIAGAPSTAGVRIDTRAPATLSVTAPGAGRYGPTQALDFTVRFSEPVVVGGAPRLTLLLDSGTVHAPYLSGSGSAELRFRHVVAAPEFDGDGIGLATAIDLAAGTLKDATGNDAALTLNGVPPLTAVLVDAKAAVVTAVTLPPDGLYGPGRELDFVVQFDEPLLVTGAAPRLPLVLASRTVHADYLSGADTAALRFRYISANGDDDADGIALGNALQLAGTLRDSSGNDATLALHGIPAGNGIRIDSTPPRVQDSRVSGAPPAQSASVQFAITFSEVVTGVDVADFVLTTVSGAVGARIAAVTGSGSDYLVSITDLRGRGEIRIDVHDADTGIVDLAGNALDGGFTAGGHFAADATLEVCYVDAAAAGSNDGTSWQDAYSDPQSALPADTGCESLWIAGGLYRAGADGFVIARPLRIHGGFAGTETTLAERSDSTIAAHPTVLSGDTDGDDLTDSSGTVPDATGIAGTNRSVIIDLTASAHSTSDTLLDGLVLTAADGHALRCAAEEAGEHCSPALSRIVFSGNRGVDGAAMHSLARDGGEASPMLDRVLFRGNRATADGAALYSRATGAGARAQPVLGEVTLVGNHGSSLIANVADGGDAVIALQHTSLFDNQGVAADGAALSAVASGGGQAHIEVSRTVLWHSGAPLHRGGGATAAFEYSIVEGAGDSGAGWSGNGEDRGGNRDADPAFGTLAWHGGAIPGLRPGAGSAAIDAAGACSGADYRGIARPQGAGCDIGATEAIQYPLEVVVSGAGTVSAITPAIGGGFGVCEAGSSCLARYPEGSTVMLQAAPASHAHFIGWSGDCASQASVVMDASANCGAAFGDNRVEVALTRTAGSTPHAYGSALELSVVLTPVAPATAMPGGSVSLLDGGVPVATAPVVDGIAIVHADTLLDIGAHSLVARYEGDAHYLAASQPLSAVLPQQVVPGSGTVQFESLAFVYSAAPHAMRASLVEDASAGCVVTPATIGPAAGSHAVSATCSGQRYTASANATASIAKAEGTVGFTALEFTYDGAAVSIGAYLVEEPAVACVPVPATVGPGAGAYAVSATCEGDNFVAHDSATATILRAPQPLTFAALPSRILGEPDFTVSASGGGSGNPVIFTSLTPGVCRSSGSEGRTISLLASGLCTLRAAQDGSADFLPAAPVEQSFQIDASGVSVTLHSDRNPADAGDTITFTAQVTGVAPGGHVRFAFDGQDIDGCAAVALAGSGDTRTALCISDGLPAGEHAIVAAYGGDADNAAGQSMPLVQQINARPVVVAPGAQSMLEDGDLGPLTILIDDAETAADTLTLAVSIDDPALVAPGGLVLGGSGAQRTLQITPQSDAHGSATVTLVVTDARGASASQHFVLTVVPVNDPPQLQLSNERLLHAAGSGDYTIPGFASATPGPSNEAAQSLTYALSTLADPQAVVASASLGADGSLHYRLGGGVGEAVLRVTVSDDGGTANGGIDRRSREFRIIAGEGAAVNVRIHRSLPLGASLPAAIAAGATLAEYVVEAENLGPSAVDGITLVVNVPDALLDVLWNCIATEPCTPANGGVGDSGVRTLNTRLTLAPGATAQLQLSGTLAAQWPWMQVIAQASLPPGMPLLGGSPRYVLIEPVSDAALHRSGFE